MPITFTAKRFLFLFTTAFLWVLAVVLIRKDEKSKHLKSTKYMLTYMLMSILTLAFAFLIESLL